MSLLRYTHTAAAVLALPAASSVLDDASLVLIASGPAMDLRNLAALHHASASLRAVNALWSSGMLQGHSGVWGQEVVQAQGKEGQGTWLVPCFSTPLMCLYMRPLFLDEIFGCEVLWLQ